MANNAPGEDLKLIPKSGGLEALVKTLVKGKDINVGDTILAYLGISREVLDERQQAAVDNLEEALTDGLNGRFRHGQVLILRAHMEGIKDIHCFTQPEPGEEALQQSLIRLVGMLNELTKQEGSLIEELEDRLTAIIDLGTELVSTEQQIEEDGNVKIATEYTLSILREKDRTKESIVEKVLDQEHGLLDLLEALLTVQLAKICGMKKEVFRSVDADTHLRQLVFKVIYILQSGEENKAGLIQEAISRKAAEIRSAQTRSAVAEAMGDTGEGPDVNFMQRGTLCPAGKRAEEQITDLTPSIEELSEDGEDETIDNDPDRAPTREELKKIEEQGEPDIDDLTPPEKDRED